MLPAGSTLGILGGGQLGLMMAGEARRLGFKVAVVDPSEDCPARGAADHFIQGKMDDLEPLTKLAKMSDVLTLETEHFPADLLAKLEEIRPLYPGSHVLAIIQDRLKQRQFLDELEIPQPAWHAVASGDEANAAAEAVGLPSILKSRKGGYDGLGQVRLKQNDNPSDGFAKLDKPAVMEQFINFDMEISILIARSKDGAIKSFPLAHNEHRGGILHITKAPVQVAPEVAEKAQKIAEKIATALDHVGMLCVELFVVGDELLVNEIAPRVHNSGHYTLGACVTSQFEQHVRAVCGLPLGDTTQLKPAAMLNILGDHWGDGVPHGWSQLVAAPGTAIHLYGKSAARPGRKMAHLLVYNDNLEAAVAQAQKLHEVISG